MGKKKKKAHVLVEKTSDVVETTMKPVEAVKPENVSSRMIYGYARVSTKGQETLPQKEEIQVYCKENFPNDSVVVFEEQISATKIRESARPMWSVLLNVVKPKDILVVTSLSRLARKLTDLLRIIDLLKEKEVQLVLLKERIDGSTETGQLLLKLFGIIYEFEATLNSERTKASLDSRRDRGILGGRKCIPQFKIERALASYDSRKILVSDICKQEEISRPTFYRYLNLRKEKLEREKIEQEKQLVS
jgi:DNA invertase Pin-like site-specific DNA recombinase